MVTFNSVYDSSGLEEKKLSWWNGWNVRSASRNQRKRRRSSLVSHGSSAQAADLVVVCSAARDGADCDAARPADHCSRFVLAFAVRFGQVVEAHRDVDRGGIELRAIVDASTRQHQEPLRHRQADAADCTGVLRPVLGTPDQDAMNDDNSQECR